MENNLSIVKNTYKELPNNIEAEQAVIGSILVTNEIFDEVNTIVSNINFRNIQFVGTDVAAHNLTAGNATAGSATVPPEGELGQIIDNGNAFPSGVTIYGRWTSVTLSGADADGGIICYFGN